MLLRQNLPFFSIVLSLTVLLGISSPRAEDHGFTKTEKSSSADHELVVMTYNIRVGLGFKGASKGSNPKETLDKIADLIREEGADVVLLQEVDRNRERTQRVNEVSHLLNRLEMEYGVFAPAIDGGDEGQYGIAVLSRYPILRDDRILLPRPPNYDELYPELPGYYAEQRILISLQVETPQGRVGILNTHLGLTRDQRLDQTKSIRAEIERAKPENSLTILGGDLNCEPGAMELMPIREVLADAYHAHPTKNGPPSDMPIIERLTFPSDEPNRCIDYLFYSANGEWKLTGTKVIETQLSDHRPVVATFIRTP